MTCVVGIVRDGAVYLGADSTASDGWSSQPRRDLKLFRLRATAADPWLAIGFTTSYRMGQVLRYSLPILDLLATVTPDVAGDRAHEWAVREFVPAARKTLKDAGYVKVEHARETSGNFLLALGAHLFEVESDWQVGWPARVYSAVGCGAKYAEGALHALTGGGSSHSTGYLMRAALRAAEHHSAGVGGPFTYVDTVR